MTFSGPQGVQQATSALQQLDGRACEVVGGRVLKLKYAKWVEEPAAGVPQVLLLVSVCMVVCETTSSC